MREAALRRWRERPGPDRGAEIEALLSDKGRLQSNHIAAALD